MAQFGYFRTIFVVFSKAYQQPGLVLNGPRWEVFRGREGGCRLVRGRGR
jgi:hypothetical protein